MVIVEVKMGDEALVSVCMNDSLSKPPKPGREGSGNDDNDAADMMMTTMTTMKKFTGNGDSVLWSFKGVSFQKRRPMFFCLYLT